jgi:hypothetical protein
LPSSTCAPSSCDFREQFVVTGLGDGQNATVTVTILKPGFYDGKFLVSSDGSSTFYDAVSGPLKTMSPPNWSGVVHTPGGFNFTITNTGTSFTTSVSTTNGVALPPVGSIVNGDYQVRYEVTGLGVDQSATVTVNIFGPGFYDGKILVSSDGSATFCVGCTII